MYVLDWSGVKEDRLGCGADGVVASLGGGSGADGALNLASTEGGRKRPPDDGGGGCGREPCRLKFCDL